MRVVHSLRHAPDRALHSARRARAAKTCRGLVPVSVVFVCHGNICRSPFASALFVRLAAGLLPARVATASYGFVSPGRKAPSIALAAAAKRGLDLSRHRSRLVTPKAVREAGLVVVMDAAQARALRRVGTSNVPVVVLGDLDPLPIETRTIVDPWGASEEVFEASYDRIERCVRELIRLFADGHALAAADDDASRASSEARGVPESRGTSQQELPH
jgi:protein-tyrosine-phosphatase